MKEEMELYIFEDEKVENLLPLILQRPVFDLFCGTTTLLDKIRRLYPRSNPHLLVREELAPTVKEKYPALPSNGWRSSRPRGGLFINGRSLFFQERKIPLQGEEEVFLSKGEIIGFRISSHRLTSFKPLFPFSENSLKDLLKDLPKREIEAKTIQYPWDLVEWNGRMISREFSRGKMEGIVDKKASLQGDPSFFSIGKGSKVGPFCLLDCSRGPILIGRDVQIRPPTVIEGPSFIGDGTHIDGAKIRGGTSIGPVCRIGGEVEDSIFQGYSNKSHEGFMGHSYIGEWVNLGAGTTNSDLKNNYSQVKVTLQRREINTGLEKVGCFIGDHTKTGIGSLITTGAILGVFSNFIGGKGASPKVIPSFSWGADEPFSPYRLEEAIETARKVMERRGVQMTKAYEDLIRKIYSQFHPKEA